MHVFVVISICNSLLGYPILRPHKHTKVKPHTWRGLFLTVYCCVSNIPENAQWILYLKIPFWYINNALVLSVTLWVGYSCPAMNMTKPIIISAMKSNTSTVAQSLATCSGPDFSALKLLLFSVYYKFIPLLPLRSKEDIIYWALYNPDIFILKNSLLYLSIVIFACNPSTQVPEAGRL